MWNWIFRRKVWLVGYLMKHDQDLSTLITALRGPDMPGSSVLKDATTCVLRGLFWRGHDNMWTHAPSETEVFCDNPQEAIAWEHAAVHFRDHIELARSVLGRRYPEGHLIREYFTRDGR